MTYINKIIIYFYFLFVFSCLLVNAEQEKNIEQNENQKIFQETLKYIQDHPLPTLKIVIYEGSQNISYFETLSTPYTSVVVVNKSSFQITQELVQAGYKPLILDMANKDSPGGSVFDGSKAQEETLCRQSNLYVGLKQADAAGYYPITEHGGILIKDVTFFRNDLCEFFENRFQTDVFASAAYDCDRNHKPIVEKRLSGCDRPEKDIDYEHGMRAKIRASFRAAKGNGNDALVFSAFGCGAFKNDPKIISQWYKEVFTEIEFQYVFKLVVFAIIPGDSQNFKAFQATF